MSSDIVNRVLDVLPAGEWRDVEILQDPGGMMAGHNWALLAKARWLRDGGRDAFLKYIVPASESAGEKTELVVGKDRLARLADRLNELHALQSKLAVVPLLEVRLVEETGGVLIAMERVEPLHNVIAEARSNIATAIGVLEALDTTNASPRWHHFDICPKNMGVSTAGAIVMIDVESIYFEQNDAFGVSVPAWKRFRAPAPLVSEVDDAFAELPRATADRKMSFEALLVATECILGLFKATALTSEYLRAWSAGRENEPAVRPLIAALECSIEGEPLPKLEVVAAELRRAGDLDQLPTARPPTAATNLQDATVIRPELDQLAYSLRAGMLVPAEIASYRSRLEVELRTAPDRRRVWNELLLIAISFEKDAIGARALVRKALKEYDKDAELNRLLRMIEMWVAGGQS